MDGADILSGGPTGRSFAEIEKFKKIVGKDPVELPASSVGNRLSNKLGDYDALYDHFVDKRDFFITLDTKDYLAITKRPHYITLETSVDRLTKRIT